MSKVLQRQPTPTAEAVYAEAGEREFLRAHSIAPNVASAKDELVAKLGLEFKRRVQDAARAVGLDPGLLAAAAIAEPGSGTETNVREAFLGTHADRVRTDFIGLDDIREQLNAIRRDVPAFRGILNTGTDFPPETGPLTRKAVLDVPGDQALLAFASYLKEAEINVRKKLQDRAGSSGIAIDFNALPAEQRFFLTRLRMNPGHNDRSLPLEQRGINPSLSKLEQGRDLFVTGMTTSERRTGEPERGATITTAQGIHLSRSSVSIHFLGPPLAQYWTNPPAAQYWDFR